MRSIPHKSMKLKFKKQDKWPLLSIY